MLCVKLEWTNPSYKADAVGLVIIQKKIISLWMKSGSILNTLIKKGDHYHYQSKLLSGFHHLEWVFSLFKLQILILECRHFFQV